MPTVASSEMTTFSTTLVTRLRSSSETNDHFGSSAVMVMITPSRSSRRMTSRWASIEWSTHWSLLAITSTSSGSIACSASRTVRRNASRGRPWG
jgi:hypothetical protein